MKAKGHRQGVWEKPGQAKAQRNAGLPSEGSKSGVVGPLEGAPRGEVAAPSFAPHHQGS